MDLAKWPSLAILTNGGRAAETLVRLKVRVSLETLRKVCPKFYLPHLHHHCTWASRIDIPTIAVCRHFVIMNPGKRPSLPRVYYGSVVVSVVLIGMSKVPVLAALRVFSLGVSLCQSMVKNDKWRQHHKQKVIAGSFLKQRNGYSTR